MQVRAVETKLPAGQAASSCGMKPSERWTCSPRVGAPVRCSTKGLPELLKTMLVCFPLRGPLWSPLRPQRRGGVTEVSRSAVGVGTPSWNGDRLGGPVPACPKCSKAVSWANLDRYDSSSQGAT